MLFVFVLLLFKEPIYSNDESLNQLSVKLKYIYDLVNTEKDFIDKQIDDFRKSEHFVGQHSFLSGLKEIQSGDKERIKFDAFLALFSYFIFSLIKNKLNFVFVNQILKFH